MSLSTQHIIRHLFRVESLEEVSRQQLEELVENYPSFGVGRYLLSSKLQAEKADHFSEETQKTNLYFTNPFWLQWLLQEDQARSANGLTSISPAVETSSVTEDTSLPAEEVFAPVVDPTEATLDTTIVPQTEPDEVGEPPVEETAPAEQTPVEPSLEETAAPSAADELLKRIAEIRDQRQAEQMATTPTPGEEAPSMGIAGLALEQTEEQGPTEQASPEEHPSYEAPAPVEHASIEEPAPAEQPDYEAQAPVEQTIHEEPAPAEQTPAEEPDTYQEHRVESVTHQTHIEDTAPAEQTPVEQPAPIDRESVEAQPSTEQASLEPEVPTALAPTPEPAPVQDPIFEPYHTVDYFASQGIRLVLDENPSDRLGRQLKSFTDWLKVMRKLPQKNREIIPDIAAERQVQAIAAHSIEGREVITEAMAEVLAKQGMREKATEMYRKLSLLEPEKSAYFAEKIEKLKIV